MADPKIFPVFPGNLHQDIIMPEYFQMNGFRMLFEYMAWQSFTGFISFFGRNGLTLKLLISGVAFAIEQFRIYLPLCLKI